MSHMSATTPSGTRLRVRNALTTVGLLTLVGVVVLGILGMHALGLHGTSMAVRHGDAATMPAAVATDSHSATHAALVAQLSGADAVHDALLTAPTGDRHDMGSMVMLCVAMLAAAAALVLGVLLARRLLRGWRPVPTLHRSLLRLLPSPAGTGPPPEWAFSVIRC